MNAFFIFALPRSRTAWLANMLTHSRSHCYHELCTELTSIMELPSWLIKTGKTYSGFADTALIHHGPRIKKMYPDARYVIVERPLTEVAASLKGMGAEVTGHLLLAYERLQTFSADNLLRIKYAELDSEQTIRTLWHHCLYRAHTTNDLANGSAQERFPKLRYQQMDTMIVETHPMKLLTRVNPDRLRALMQEANSDE